MTITTIFLIGDTGAARTTDETMAKALERIANYTTCTREEYTAKRCKIRALDTAIALSDRHDLQHTVDAAEQRSPRPTRAHVKGNLGQAMGEEAQ